MSKQHIFSLAAMILAVSAASAQGLSNKFSVSHEVIPEEQAATRLRIFPTVQLRQVDAGRLSAAANFAPATLTPFINHLEPVGYLTDYTRSPWRGYAALGYGPVYNLAASAGYRFIENKTLTLDGFLQFDGVCYKSRFPSMGHIYADKVSLHRNSALVGTDVAWTPEGINGGLKASLIYQYSGYNFPVLDLPTATVTPYDLNANFLNFDADWKGSAGKLDYNVGLEYNMMAFALNEANNGGKLDAGVLWHHNNSSAWGLDFSASVINSTIVDNKGIIHVEPHYVYTGSHFSAKVGVDMDFRTGNAAYDKRAMIAPRVDLLWQPSAFFNIWGKVSGKLDDNARWKLYNEQPYLMADFDAGYSRIYFADAGINLGPWRGASIGIFGGYVTSKDWYMPAIETGYMAPIDVKGFHGGITLAYDYKQFVSVNAKAELAQSPDDKYTSGYALWRDHARFDLSANLTVRPIDCLEVNVGYHLRTHRSKMLSLGSLNLLSVNNLSAGVRYSVNSNWSAFVRGENLMNRHWYMSPSVPSQGIMAMVGATYKF